MYGEFVNTHIDEGGTDLENFLGIEEEGEEAIGMGKLKDSLGGKDIVQLKSNHIPKGLIPLESLFDQNDVARDLKVEPAINVIKDIGNNDKTMKLVDICPNSTFFSFRGESYEQKGVEMVSPLSPIVSNIFMENLEKDAIDSFPLKPKWWLQFVDDVYSNWPHGEEALKEFIDHLNKQSDSMKFTTEREEKRCVPFLNILTIRKQDDSLGH